MVLHTMRMSQEDEPMHLRIMEVILYDAFQIMKDTGVEWGSMGLAPLAHLDNPENDKR